MRWASAIATPAHLGDAVAEATESLADEIEPAEVDLVIAFVSSHYGAHIERLAELLRQAFPAATLFGCSATGTIGAGREVEGDAALAVMAGTLGDATARVLHFASDPESWTQPHCDSDEPAQLVVLTDPTTVDSERLLGRLERWYGDRATIVGGLASTTGGPGSVALLTDRGIARSGALVLELTGNIEIDTIVAQGCRPIGEPMFITQAHRNLIAQLDGRPAVDALEQLHGELSDEDRAQLQGGLHIGIAMNPTSEVYEAGDFLIRDLIGVDMESKLIGIGFEPKTPQVIQFHVRDADTADEELRDLLARHQYARPTAVLLFSCIGRGHRLFGCPNHDSAAFAEQFGEVPIAGFFGNGEIGPVRGQTFIHGYTSAFALIRPTRDDS